MTKLDQGPLSFPSVAPPPSPFFVFFADSLSGWGGGGGRIIQIFQIIPLGAFAKQ